MLLYKFNELFYSKKYDECIKFLEDEKKNKQNDQNEINYYISKVYYQLALLSDENEKKSFFDKIEKLLQNNTYDKSKKLLALVYNEESSYDKAIEIYNEIINNGNDKDYKYHVYKANALHNKYNNDDLNKIIYDYKRAMNSDSEDIYKCFYRIL